MLNKTALRRSMLAARLAISPELRANWDAAIGARLKAQLMRQPLQTLGIYWPIQGEPDLREAYADLADRGVQLALPAVTRKNAPLEFFAWRPGDALGVDACGVAAPTTRDTPVVPQVLLIPCVGFNPQGFRLGYGSGYYDRTLEREPRPMTIGIAYSCLLTLFDAASHDVALDTIITESSTTCEDHGPHIR